jgi:ATP-dependent DNA helicase UvrD/PcrA
MDDSNDPILKDLNPEQRQAVLHGEGPLVIFAGAGSGKTRVLTHRIAHLVARRGADPNRILAVTFTNKAAGEMKERVERLMPGIGENVWVSTFHSACVRFLRRDADKIDLRRDFSIYDTGDQRTLVKDILKKAMVDEKILDYRAVLQLMDQAKNDLSDPLGLAEGMKPERRAAYEMAVKNYVDNMRRNNALDFGDLMVFAVRLLEADEQVRAQYQWRFQHILVDEFQDTNCAQSRLLELLLGDHRNLCVVGDDDQSIYRWRGARIENILDFETRHPGAQKVILGRNYRSSANILGAAEALISHNVGREPKRLVAEKEAGRKVRVYRADDEYDEAQHVSAQIGDLRRRVGLALSDIAIFYRVNALSRVFEEELMSRGFPYVVLGGMRFYERKEVKDILAYMRLTVNPDDSVAAKRIINFPVRKIGKTTIGKIDAFAMSRKLSFLVAARLMVEEGALTKAALKAVSGFLNIIDDITAAAKEDAPPEALAHIIKRTGYKDMLEADQSVDGQTRKENIGELYEAVAQFSERRPNDGLADYLESVSLMQDADALDARGDGVRLMTLHNAKGLEFPAAFIVGMEDGLLPHARSLRENPAFVEEERRLCYVGITRAGDYLTMSCAARRRTYGGQPSYAPPSRFLAEIPEDMLDVQGFGFGYAIADAMTKTTRSPQLSFTRDKTPAPPPTAQSIISEGDSVCEYDESPDVRTFHTGAHVMHDQFGQGKIMGMLGYGKKAKAIVHFHSVGVKTLLLGAAKLRVISG